MSSAHSQPARPRANGEEVALLARRNRQARRLRLRFDGLHDRVLLTVPGRTPIGTALDWARQHAGWVEGQRLRAGGVIRIEAGALVPVEGESRLIVATGGSRRQCEIGPEGLLVGGPPEHIGARVMRWLRERARASLDAETQELARRHALPLGKVSIGDPRARWGSCSANGDIRYSWRLILAPPMVRLATVAHEVAHLRHMHHGPEFHDMVRAISAADPDAARSWLRREGAGLHRYVA